MPVKRFVSSLIAVALFSIATVSTSPAAMQPDPEELDTVGVYAYLCDAGEQPGTARGCEPLAGVTMSISGEDGTEYGSCVTELYEAAGGIGAGCSVDVPYGTPVIITEDISTVPSGYAPVENPQAYTTPPSLAGSGPGPGATFRNVAQEAAGPTAVPDETTEATDETAPVDSEATINPEGSSEDPAPGSAGTGRPAAIYAGDCETDFTDAEEVAVLSEVTEPQGEQRGAESAFAAETSFTTLDLPFDDILVEDHVLVVFDEDDDTVVLACGSIGGIVTDDGTLIFGLPAVGESRFSGVAYLTEDGEQTQVSVFLAEALSSGETPTA